MVRAVDEYLLVAKLLEDCPIMIVQRSGLFRTSVFFLFHKLVGLLLVAMRTEKCLSRWGVGRVVEGKEERIACVGGGPFWRTERDGGEKKEKKKKKKKGKKEVKGDQMM